MDKSHQLTSPDVLITTSVRLISQYLYLETNYTSFYQSQITENHRLIKQNTARVNFQVTHSEKCKRRAQHLLRRLQCNVTLPSLIGCLQMFIIKTDISNLSFYQISHNSKQTCEYLLSFGNICNPTQIHAAYGKLWALQMTSIPLKSNIFWKQPPNK